MKILAISNLYPPHFVGGYEQGCRDVVEELRRRGHDVRVLTSRYGGVYGKDRGAENFRELFEVVPPKRWYHVPRMPFWEIRNQAVLEKHLDEFQPELVYFWNISRVSISAVEQVARRNLPAAWYVSDESICEAEKTDIWLRCVYQKGRGFPARVAAGVVRAVFFGKKWKSHWPPSFLPELHCTSRFIADRVERAGLKAKTVKVIPWGIPDELFHSQRRNLEEEVGSRPVKFLFAGRLVPDKGFHTAVAAFIRFYQENPAIDATFVVAGAGPAPFLDDLKRKIEAAGLAEKVDFKGKLPRAELLALYSTMDVFVFASEWNEPFAIAPLEAMASGCAVIATLTGGSPEIFRDGDNALTFEAGNSEALARQMARMACDPALRKKLAASARENIGRQYLMSHMVNHIEDRLHAIVEEGAEKNPAVNFSSFSSTCA